MSNLIIMFHHVSCIHGTLLLVVGNLIRLSTHGNSVDSSIKYLFLGVGHWPSLLFILGYLWNNSYWWTFRCEWLQNLLIASKFRPKQGQGLVRYNPHGMCQHSAFSSCTPGQLPLAGSGKDALTDSHGCLCFSSFSDELNVHPKKETWLSSTWAYCQPSRLALWLQAEWIVVLSAYKKKLSGWMCSDSFTRPNCQMRTRYRLFLHPESACSHQGVWFHFPA